MNDQTTPGRIRPGEQSAAASDPPAIPAKQGRRKKWRGVLAFFVFAVGLAAVGYWFYGVWSQVRVYDARISAEVLSISSRVEGWITKVAVKESQKVKAGDPLYVIDGRKALLRLAELDAAIEAVKAERAQLRAEAKMIDEQTGSRLEASRATLSATKAALSVLATELKQSQADFKRAQSLLEKKVLSRQRWEALRTELQAAQQRHLKGSADVARAEAAIVEAQASRQQVQVVRERMNALAHQEAQLESQRQRQRLDIEDRTIRAPIDGIIDRTFFDAGEYVVPGQRLLMMHDSSKIWVEANFKETDIRKIKLGDQAKVRVDAYPDIVQTGRISRIGNAAISQFALLPTPNPSGNFTKITQRLPVRIEVEQVDGLLRPGMMVEVAIDLQPR